MNYLKYISWIWFLLNAIDTNVRGTKLSRYKSCLPPQPLLNGRIRYSNYGRKLTFYCNSGYQRIGNFQIRCSHGEWDGPPPLCASSGCKEFPLLHGKAAFTNTKSLAKVECDPDFDLIGSPYMYCDTWGWNDTIPECQVKSIHQFDICTFESGNTKQCNWIIKSMIFNWVVVRLATDNSSYIPENKLPPYDHTLGPHQKTGHVLYLEPMFLPSTMVGKLVKAKQISAQYISPLFPAFEEMSEMHCLIFYLYAKEHSNVTMEVFVGDEMICSIDDNLVSKWVEIKINLPFQYHSFRIRIEGKTADFQDFSGTAIDDLRITSGLECKKQLLEDTTLNLKSTVSTSTTIQSTVSTTSEETNSFSSSSIQITTWPIIYEISPTTTEIPSLSTSEEDSINIGSNQNNSNHLSGEILFDTSDKNILDEMKYITHINDSEYHSDGKNHSNMGIPPSSTFSNTQIQSSTVAVYSSSPAKAFESSSVTTTNISKEPINSMPIVTSEPSRPVIRNNDVSQFKKPFVEEKNESSSTTDQSSINSKSTPVEISDSQASNTSQRLKQIYKNYQNTEAMIYKDPFLKRDLNFLVRKQTDGDNLLRIFVWGVSFGCVLLLAVLLIAISSKKYYYSCKSNIRSIDDDLTEFYKNDDIELDYKDKGGINKN